MNLRNALIGVAAALSLQVTATTLSWGSKDRLYRPDDTIAAIITDTVAYAWRGERIGVMALIRPTQDIVASLTVNSPLTASANFTRYLLTDDFRACGKHPEDLTPWPVADIIDAPTAKIPAGQLLPIWLTIEVPRDIPAGQYPLTLSADGESIALVIDIADRTLPLPSNQQFYLNLWQQPYAIARYYNVEPWSPEHFCHLAPYAKMLARAGQKTISTILFYEPWGEQSNDPFLPMVQTTRMADGTWQYDYSVFDRWVQFMDSIGVGPHIECFTMIPWEMKFRYFDQPSGDYQFLHTTTSSPEYRNLWGSFLKAFAAHLESKGWTDRTLIAMDERSMPDMQNAIAVIDSVAPQLQISLAGNYHPEIADRITSLSITQGDLYPAGEPQRRRQAGKVTTLYTCCSSPQPNLFSNSMPADAAWLPVHCTATGHDGYLHWSWSNWTDSPLTDTRFKLFAPGDTYFIYPDAKSSVRFERLIEGIQTSEKVRILQQSLPCDQLLTLHQALIPLTAPNPRRATSTAQQLNHLHNTINQLSK